IVSVSALRYKIVHVDVFSGPAFLLTEISTVIARLRRKKIILTLRGGALPVFYNHNTNRVRSILTKALYLQTPSYYLKEFFECKGLHINYLPNGIDLNQFKYER